MTHIFHLNITIFSVSLSGNVEKIDFLNYKKKHPNRHVKILKHMKNLYLLYNEVGIIQDFFDFQKNSFQRQKSQSSRNKKTKSSKIWGQGNKKKGFRKQQSNYNFIVKPPPQQEEEQKQEGSFSINLQQSLSSIHSQNPYDSHFLDPNPGLESDFDLGTNYSEYHHYIEHEYMQPE